MGVGAYALAFGQSLITGAQVISTPTERSDQSASAGWYVEQQLAFNQRLFLTAAMRRDASSAFGGNIKNPTFPKYGASWVVSNEPFFPKQGVLTEMRLRAAYGEAGKQGAQTDVIRNFRLATGVPGSVPGPIAVVSGLGNPSLQPQRDREWEGGFDLSFFDSRATVTTTWYRKFTHNAIMTINVAPSSGAVVSSLTTNVGDIQNTGAELDLSVRPIDRRSLTWDVRVSASSNTNTLLRKADLQDLPSNTGGKIIPGYPLFSLWMRPIISYADADGDGILEKDEIVFGDTAIYAGTTAPKGSVNYANTVTLLGGTVSVSALLSQVNGLGTQFSTPRVRGAVDPTSSLAEQAGYLQSTTNPNGYVGTVSYVSFSELSASVNLPARFAQRLHARAAQFAVVARNLGFWSNYRGADPMVSDASTFGDGGYDIGRSLSQPRNWTLRLNLQF
jgi:hypothetical protein